MNSERISCVVVDDHPALLAAVSDSLAEHGYDILAAHSNCRDAVDAVTAARAAVGSPNSASHGVPRSVEENAGRSDEPCIAPTRTDALGRVENAGGVMVTADSVSQAQVLGPRVGVLRQQLLPKPHASEVKLHAGDMLVLATDGVADQSLGSVDRLASVQAAGDRMLAAARQGNDDALVLVARYRGDAT
jgi:serine/threonine protein phosphatase PrpC